jgi:hypothetical protein
MGVLAWLLTLGTAGATHIESTCGRIPPGETRSVVVQVPASVENPFCNAACDPARPIQPVVPGTRFSAPPNALLHYADRTQAQCERKIGAGERGDGVCRLDTLCRPGAVRVVDGAGVVRCQNPERRELRTVNAQQECLRTTPLVPQVAISGVRGSAGGSGVRAGTTGMLFVGGTNVGLPGNTVRSESGDAQVSIIQRPECTSPSCLALAVTVAAGATGPRAFVIREPHGGVEVRGAFEVVAATGSAGSPAGARDGRFLKIRTAAPDIRQGQTLAGNAVTVQLAGPATQPTEVRLGATTSPPGRAVLISPDRFTVPAGTTTVTFTFNVTVGRGAAAQTPPAATPGGLLSVGAQMAIAGAVDSAVAQLSIIGP